MFAWQILSETDLVHPFKPGFSSTRSLTIRSDSLTLIEYPLLVGSLLDVHRRRTGCGRGSLEEGKRRGGRTIVQCLQWDDINGKVQDHLMPLSATLSKRQRCGQTKFESLEKKKSQTVNSSFASITYCETSACSQSCAVFKCYKN